MAPMTCYEGIKIEMGAPRQRDGRYGCEEAYGMIR